MYRIPVKKTLFFLRIWLLSSILLGNMGNVCAQEEQRIQRPVHKKQISGQVIDEDGEPIIGANIWVANDPSVNTYSDIEGRYTFVFPEDVRTIVFSSLGFKRQEVDVRRGIPRYVILSYDAQTMEDHPYTPLKSGRKTVHTHLLSSPSGYSESYYSGITANPMESPERWERGIRQIPNYGTGIQGRQIFLRGVHSLSSSEPLYIIDGMPMPSDPSGMLLSYLNAADISSVYVLKDANETAYYGAQGAGGVVMIYTQDAINYAKMHLSARGGYTWKPEVEGLSLRNVFSQQYTFKVGNNILSNSFSQNAPSIYFSLDYLHTPSAKKSENMERYSARLNLDQRNSIISYGLGSAATLLKTSGEEGAQFFVSPYLRMEITDYLFFSTHAGLNHYRPLTNMQPFYDLNKRNSGHISNLFTYQKTIDVYGRSSIGLRRPTHDSFDIVVSGGQEARWVYGNRLISVPARAEVTYKKMKKYRRESYDLWKLMLNYRYDNYHVSRQSRGASFGSVGLRHNLLYWLDRSTVFQKVDLSASYGTTGNISPWAIDSWESTGKLNIGLDISTKFRRGLHIKADYYRHTTSDLLLPVSQTTEGGFSRKAAVDTRLRNHGVELSLSSFLYYENWCRSWGVEINASHNAGKLSGYDLTDEKEWLSTDPWIVYYYDPNWFGAFINKVRYEKYECLLQCNYSFGGSPLIREGNAYTGGNSFSLYSIRVSYRPVHRKIGKIHSRSCIFVEGNQLVTLGQNSPYRSGVLYPGRNLTIGMNWDL